MDMMTRLVLVMVALGVIWTERVYGFPVGAPEGQCSAMQPNHGPAAQSSTPPFTLDLSPGNSYVAGSELQVTIKSTSSTTFKGFLIEARPVGGTSPVGQFTTVAGTDTICTGGGLTHTGGNPGSGEDKTTLTFTWTAPSSGVGNIEFVATIVSVKATYWMGVKSEVVTGPTGPTQASTPATTPATTPVITPAINANALTAIETSSCGLTKGCYFSPPKCSGAECDAIITWTPEASSAGSRKKRAPPTYVDFEFMGRSDGWVALGLSKDQTMGDDSVLECVRIAAESDRVEPRMSYNPGRYNNKAKWTDGISNAKGSFSNGEIRCNFRRTVTVAGNPKIFDLSESYNLLVARGDADAAGTKSIHNEKSVLTEMVDVTSDANSYGGTVQKNTLAKAHGCLMLAAWMLSAGTAIILARFFKQAWPDTSLCAKPVWFTLHRLLMLVVLACTCVGFILIFVQRMGYSYDLPAGFQMAHPILGIIVTALCIVNPIMAAFRPHPGTAKRPLFNWCHRSVGLVAFLLATITLFFGVNLDSSKAFTGTAVFYLLLAYACIYILVFIALEVHSCIQDKKQDKERYEMKAAQDLAGGDDADQSAPKPSQPPTAGDLKIKYVLIGFYFISVLALFIAMVVLIAT